MASCRVLVIDHDAELRAEEARQFWADKLDPPWSAPTGDPDFEPTALRAADDSDEDSRAFLEALASLTLTPRLGVSPHAEGRRTLRFGEVPSERGSSWPQVVLGSSWAPTLGASRMIDPGSLYPVLDSDRILVWRRALPPSSAPLSLSALARAAEVVDWADGERNSEVRLRSAVLSREWYELTGTGSV